MYRILDKLILTHIAEGVTTYSALCKVPDIHREAVVWSPNLQSDRLVSYRLRELSKRDLISFAGKHWSVTNKVHGLKRSS